MGEKTADTVVLKDRLVAFICLSAVFALGAFIGRQCWESIRLPFSNPWNIVGPLTVIRSNPNDSYLRCLAMVALPSALLWVLYFLNINYLTRSAFAVRTPPDNTEVRPSRRRTGIVVLLITMVLFSMLMSLYVKSDIACGPFDTFHEGESVGPAALCLRGQIPYRDFALFHGAFQDPLRSVVAFKLLGHSIAATRTFGAMIKVLEFALIACLVAFLFMPSIKRTITAFTLFLLTNFIFLRDDAGIAQSTLTFAAQRDVTLYGYLLALFWLYRLVRSKTPSPKKVSIAAFTAAFIALATLIYSVDRGTYFLVSYALFVPALYLIFVHRQPYRPHYIFGSLAGLTTAALLLGSVIGWDYSAFFEYTFMLMPKYFDLFCGLEYPIGIPVFLWTIVLLAGNAYWVMLQFIRQFHADNRHIITSLAAFLRSYFEETLLLVLGILFFRSATGRSDWQHLAIASNLLFLLAFVIVLRHSTPRLSPKLSKCCAVLVVLMAVPLFATILRSLSIETAIRQNFPLGVPDLNYLPKYYLETADFVMANLEKDETFYTFTSEGVWYYLIDRPTPTRYPLAYTSTPDFMQRQVAKELTKNRCKIILVRNDHWACEIDDFPAAQRFPILVKFIETNYRPYKQIGDNELWIRMDAVKDRNKQ